MSYNKWNDPMRTQKLAFIPIREGVELSKPSWPHLYEVALPVSAILEFILQSWLLNGTELLDDEELQHNVMVSVTDHIDDSGYGEYIHDEFKLPDILMAAGDMAIALYTSLKPSLGLVKAKSRNFTIDDVFIESVTDDDVRLRLILKR